MADDITIEGSRATWVLPPTDGRMGGTYTGRFVFNCFLAPTDMLKAGRVYRSLLGEHAGMATTEEGHIAFALTQLKFRVVSAPPFWTSTLQDSEFSGNIGDLNIIGLVLDAAMEAEVAFKEKIVKEREALLERSIKVAEQLLNKGEDNGDI